MPRRTASRWRSSFVAAGSRASRRRRLRSRGEVGKPRLAQVGALPQMVPSPSRCPIRPRPAACTAYWQNASPARTDDTRRDGSSERESPRPVGAVRRGRVTRQKQKAEMTDVLETVIEAHGGLERWNQLDAVTAWLVRGEPSGASRAMRRSSMTSSSGQACTRSRCRTICSALPTREARSPRSESQSGPPRGTSSNRPWAWPGTAVRCQPDGHAGCAAPRRAGRRAGNGRSSGHAGPSR